MASGYAVASTDLDSIFGPKGANTAAATGIKVAGVDLNARYLRLADGIALTYATGIKVNGADLNTFFGAPATALPINGQTFNASATSGTGASSASYIFSASTSGWSVTGSSSGGGSVSPGASGAIPSGATQVQYTTSVASSAGTFSSSNTTTSGKQPLTTSQTVSAGATGTPSTVDSHIWLNVTITFYNAANAAISTTNIQLRASAAGAS